MIIVAFVLMLILLIGFDVFLKISNFKRLKNDDIVKDEKFLINNFTPTKKFDKISFDDNNRMFIVKGNFCTNLYYYDQILDFELIEKCGGDTIVRGGLGSAVVGGMLFGAVGAVVGGMTSSRKVNKNCSLLQIKIVIKNSDVQTIYIPFITGDTKIGSSIYQKYFKKATDVLSALQVAVDMIKNEEYGFDKDINNSFSVSGADEILKYKKLYDDGIITLEEFNKKKDEILNNK